MRSKNPKSSRAVTEGYPPLNRNILKEKLPEDKKAQFENISRVITGSIMQILPKTYWTLAQHPSLLYLRLTS